MLVVETVVRIRREHAGGKPIKEIARDLRSSRKVICRSPARAGILGHWGEVVLFYLERTAAVLGRAPELDRPLGDYACRNLYVTGSGMWSEPYLRRCLEIVGPDRLLFSTDFPYQYNPGGEPRRFLDTVTLDDAARRGLAFANWERLTRASN